MPGHKFTMVFGPAQASTVNPAAGVTSYQGWTESWYRPANETDAAAMLWADILVLQRRLLLTPGWAIKQVRMSVFPLNRSAFRRTVTPDSGRGTYSGAGVLDEQPWDVLIQNVGSATGKTRNSALHGIGSDVVSPGGLYLAPEPFATRFANWASWLIASWGIRYTTSITPQPIVGVLAVPSGNIGGAPYSDYAPAVQIQGPLQGWINGSQVRISGVIGMSGMNGIWTISSAFTIANVSTYTLRPKRLKRVQGTWTAGGMIAGITSAIDPILSVVPGDGSTHKVGRPFAGRRGRRSSRR